MLSTPLATGDAHTFVADQTQGVNNVRSTLFSMPTAKLTGEEWSGKCRVKSPESRVQTRSTFRTPHFIVLGISENKVRLGLLRIIRPKENAPESD
jgi:hypothetical protein